MPQCWQLTRWLVDCPRAGLQLVQCSLLPFIMFTSLESSVFMLSCISQCSLGSQTHDCLQTHPCSCSLHLVMMLNLASLSDEPWRDLIPTNMRKWQTNPWNSTDNKSWSCIYCLACILTICILLHVLLPSMYIDCMYIDYRYYWLACILTRVLVETNQR